MARGMTGIGNGRFRRTASENSPFQIYASLAGGGRRLTASAWRAAGAGKEKGKCAAGHKRTEGWPR